MDVLRRQIRLSFGRIGLAAFGVVALLSTLLVLPRVVAAAPSGARPTIVLVHGAFAESSSWSGVVSRLVSKGYPVVAVANPLRGVRVDAAYLSNVIDAIPGPVILVGHSYGGMVITNAATGKANVKALIYVAGLAPDQGESASALVGRFPGSTLGPTLAPPTSLADGGKDLYIDQSKFHAQFAADLPASEAAVMAATQRPIVAAAFDELSGPPAWKTIRSWFIYGSRDKNIPPVLQSYMAKRASAMGVVEVKGASHVVMISHPDLVTKIIEQAASAVSE